MKVPEGKVVKVTFNKFLLDKPGQNSKTCDKDYVKINEKKWVKDRQTQIGFRKTAGMWRFTFFHRVCGEKPINTVIETSKNNQMTVTFRSDKSYVDRGFDAEFEAIIATDRKY